MEYIGDILYDEKLLKANKRFVIFGSGMFGRHVLEYLILNGMKDKVVCFCDSNDNLDGSTIEEVPIYKTADVLMHYKDAEYLIGGKYFKEMYQILREENIEKIHFFIS